MNHNIVEESLPETGTWFAPAERSSVDELRDLVEFCQHNPVTQAIIASVDGYVLILNEQRQVLAANPSVLKDLNIETAEHLIGLRPGEIFGCIYNCDAPGGCGTAKNCSTCGAVITLLSSQILYQPTTGECLMTVQENGHLKAHEFSVRATPLQLENSTLTIFVIHDISSSKRSDALENIILHDLKNVVTGLRGWSEILIKRPQDAGIIAQKIVNLSTRLTDEVENQRILLLAERGELQVTCEYVPVSVILDSVRAFFSGYPPDKVYDLIIHSYETPLTVHTYLPLLTRVLAYMVKNALEASNRNEQVHVRFEVHKNTACFTVHNEGYIPEAVALQIFRRSFSTRNSPGRGLGTYSMKLFGEQYLGGTVGFHSNEKTGTSFYISLPCTH